jgi:hypothetical protein
MSPKKIMKLLKPIMAASVCCLMFVAAPGANALIVDDGFVFEANPGQPTDFNGSIIILKDQIYGQGVFLLNWDLVDSAVPGFVPLTLNNSVVETQSFTSDSLTTWDGSFTITNSEASFFGTNFPGSGVLDATIDPKGKWIPLGASATPDGGNSVGLLAAALGVLGLARRFVARQGLTLGRSLRRTLKGTATPYFANRKCRNV